MNIRNLIPKEKDDIITAEKLKNFSYEELKPIIPELLEWLQDCNWPVAKPVSLYLESICDKISYEIIEVFKTNDLEWQYYMILIFGPITQDKSIATEIIRIANYPTVKEIEAELNQVAKDIVLKRNWN